MKTFPKDQPSNLGCYFVQEGNLFFKLDLFPQFRPNPYTRMCVLTIGSLSRFRKIVTNHCNTPVTSWVFWNSLIWDFSVYFEYS